MASGERSTPLSKGARGKDPEKPKTAREKDNKTKPKPANEKESDKTKAKPANGKESDKTKSRPAKEKDSDKTKPKPAREKTPDETKPKPANRKESEKPKSARVKTSDEKPDKKPANEDSKMKPVSFARKDLENEKRGCQVMVAAPLKSSVESQEQLSNGRKGMQSRVEKAAERRPGSSASSSLSRLQPLESVVEKELDDRLKNRLEKLRMRMKQIGANAAVVNRIKEVILKHLKSEEHHSHWEAFNSGSYYEKTKITRPNEYDCMFTCRMRFAVEYQRPGDDAVFCKLRSLAINPGDARLPVSNSWILTDPDQHNGGAQFFCPVRFKKHFKDMVESVIQKEIKDKLNDLRIKLNMTDVASPAVTFEVHKENETFSFDVVPAIQLFEWPKPAQSWSCRWQPGLDNDIKNPDTSGIHPYVVAKIHPTEASKANNSNSCFLWRLSFSSAEKLIMRKTSESSGNGCRKDVLKLLKADLEDFKENNPAHLGDTGFCSFYLKMIFLQLLDDEPEDDSWTRQDLRRRYVQGLTSVIKCMEKKKVKNYFIKSANILDTSGVLIRKFDALKQHFTDQRESYSVGL